MSRKSLGEFEQQVLVAMLRLGPESYTVSIVMELQERTHRSTSLAAVYIALRRLEKRGLVASRLDVAPPEGGGRPRRYFKLQDAALVQLRESRMVMDRLWEGVRISLEKN